MSMASRRQLFFSASLGGGENEARVRELHREVCRLGVNGNIVLVGGGGDIGLATVEGLHNMAAMIVWGTDTYGEMT
jgi:hypothetical protein